MWVSSGEKDIGDGAKVSDRTNCSEVVTDEFDDLRLQSFGKKLTEGLVKKEGVGVGRRKKRNCLCSQMIAR